MNKPTALELNVLLAMLRKAAHPKVAEAMAKGFMWACWPEWYKQARKEFLHAHPNKV